MPRNFSIAWTNNATRIDEMPVAGRKDVHGDYGEFCYKGYRHSLCHGWSAGPAAWLVNRVLGVEIAAPGGRAVRVKPFLGDLDIGKSPTKNANRYFVLSLDFSQVSSDDGATW